MHKDNIITPDKILSLATNWLSRYSQDISYVPERNIFFIKPDFLSEFKQRILPNITYKFILLTHDSDIPVNSDCLDILDNPYLIKWFGMNCHIIHDKLQPIPIGMANEVWPHGNKDIVEKIIQENNSKTNLVYCNYDIYTNFKDRSYCIDQLKQNSFIDFEFTKLSFEDYLRKLSTYKYVISPPGNSVDCHRIWESMYVKTIPICMKSIPLVYFKDAPILFINDWRYITPELLNEKYTTLISRDTQKADFNFYKNQIQELALSLL
jgi:hypothetical protein